MKHVIYRQWSIIFVIGMVLFMFVPTAYGLDGMDNYSNIVSIDVNCDSKTNSLMSYEVDVQGNITGPEDFAIDVNENEAYILNSVNNTVLRYVSGRYMHTLFLDDIGVKAIKIACDKGYLYVLGNDYSIQKIDSKGVSNCIQLNIYLKDKTVTDFNVINEKLFVSTIEGDFGTTYKVDLRDRGKNSQRIESFEGRVFNENTIYKVDLLTKDRKSIGHSCMLTISNIDTQKSNSIILTSEYWVAGAQYLGVDDNGNYIIKLFELASKPDYTIVAEETIRKISPEGDLKGICGLEKQVKYIANQTKSFGDKTYHLNNLNNVVQILKISVPEESNVKEYCSVFDNIVEPEIQIPNSHNSKSTIARSTIMANARSFHSSFSWTCTSANLAALTNWTKPRYVGSAGTYSHMPYCWGGFSSISQYNTGMSNGGRVGNINTSSSSHVSNTFGLDCSGYVSRCWGLNSHYGTGIITNVSTQINISNILGGDALNNHPYHIVLFDDYDSYGNFILYESTKLNSYDRVSHTVRSASSMSNYIPIRYNNVI